MDILVCFAFYPRVYMVFCIPTQNFYVLYIVDFHIRQVPSRRIFYFESIKLNRTT